MKRLVFLVLIAALFSGCANTYDSAVNTATTAAAGNDRYMILAAQALDGSVDPEFGLEPVHPFDWEKTPRSVRLLVEKLTQALSANRLAFHSIVFQLDAGPDPETIESPTLTVPEVEDDSAGLLEDDNGR